MTRPGGIQAPSLSDGRVRLREWTGEDAAVIARIATDPAIPRWTYLPQAMNEEQARVWIHAGITAARAGTGLRLAVEEEATGQIAGNVALGSVDRDLGTAEVFWWLGPEARGRGIATAALRLLGDWSLDHLQLARLTALIEPANTPSLRLAERVGFRREGLLRAAEPATVGGGRIDLLLLSLLPDDR